MSPETATSVHPTDIHAKALALNLDSKIYGTFAEIGAGQEVARWFLRVGAASGTVAQTICAYDKTFSDQTYGAGTRYVSRERLIAMLDHEYAVLVSRLAATRGADTRFFVFADTIATRNFKGDNDQHGWVGIRFQTAAGAEPSDVLLHVNLMDSSAQLQQEAVGAFGVNLVYAAFHQHRSVDTFLSGLSDGLSRLRIETDFIELRGPAFAGADGCAWNLHALRKEMCRAIVLDSSARVIEPASALRKRPLIVERGRFETIEAFQSDMLAASLQRLKSEPIELQREPVRVLEMTIHHAADTSPPPAVDEVLGRARRAAPLADALIVSDFAESYHLTDYLRRHTTEPVRMVLGVAALVYLFNEKFYRELPGALLEGLAKFLATNVKVYAYPMPTESFRRAISGIAANRLMDDLPPDRVGAADIHPAPPLHHLYRFLCEAGWIIGL